jgi:N-acetylglucosamine-6-sulfatase
MMTPSSLWRAALLALLALITAAATVDEVAKKKPNLLFILTDDQDWHMHSLEYMPLLQKYLINEGTVFENHYCTVAVCCPSRVNLWTGRTAHNVRFLISHSIWSKVKSS